MFTIKNSFEFIADIKVLDERLKNIRINSIEIDRKAYKIKYNFVCDKAVDDELQQKILVEAEKISSPIFKEVQVSVKKMVANDELVNVEIYKFLTANYTSISIFLKPTDIMSTTVGDVVKYTVRLTKDGSEYVHKNGVITKLNEHLSKNFCSDFIGEVDIKESEETISLLDDNVYKEEIEKIEHRTIKVKDVLIIDDLHMGNIALYIEDAHQGVVTVCGTITDIKERIASNNKPYMIISIDDTTGKMSGCYFSKKSTYHKIKELAVGDAIIARGTIKEHKGKPSFTFDKINRCTFPTDFVKEDKYKKSAPKNYTVVFPSPARETVKVKSVFDAEENLPQELTEKNIVVFDLETTGFDHLNNGITEIGAVKMVNGKAVEQFTTLVKPDYKITDDNASVTGITEEMVKDAPKIATVIPDFMKFIEGCTLVAHNAEFDMKFIKRFAGASGYEVKNPVIDSLELARKTLPELRRHDLHTIADHFSIVFQHHRALPDAYTTSEVFVEMMKIKNS